MAPPTTPYQPYAALHTNPSGEGDERPTALQIVKDAGLQGKLGDKVILITGTSGGIGAETARALYETGAQLFLTARDMPKLEKTIDDIVKNAEIKDAPRPQPLQLELGSLADIRRAVEEFRTRSNKLNILVANAGVFITPFGHTEDGFETQFGTNHLAHFYLFQLLKPLLLETAAKSGTTSRVITVSSGGHRRAEVDFEDPNFEKRAYDGALSYGQSKTANIWMSNEIDRRYGSQNLHATSLHPGVIMTDLVRYLTQEDLARLGLGSDLLNKVMKSGPQGAATTVWAAISPHFEGYGGVYLADVGEAAPANGRDVGPGPLYAAHVYSPEKEAQLWKLSNKLVGIDGD